MYSNIRNVNILTSVLKSHGLRRAVVCPGSRNAPIVHNLNEVDGITCYPITDERSAGFVAMGLAMGDPSPQPDPVAVVVTSGTALLNLYPAVAEAYYQKLPLVVISADRPEAWIGQQDGQTLPQPGVFGTMVNRSVNLPMVSNGDEQGEQAWHCERLVHEAIIDCVHRRIGPVHINVPIAEPLYQFTQSELPATHWLDYVDTNLFGGTFHHGDLVDFLNAKKPMIIVGQDYPCTQLRGIKNIQRWAVTLIEPTALATYSQDPARREFSDDLLVSSFEEVLARLERGNIQLADVRGYVETYEVSDMMPDFILYVGGTLVSKRLKQFLRRAARSREDGGGGAKVWRVSRDGECIDTLMHLDRIFCADPDQLADAMTSYEQVHPLDVDAYRERWWKALRMAKRHAYLYEPEYSSMAAVKYFQQEFLAHSLDDTHHCRLFYANSMPIRLACIYARQYVHCHRGVSGIEGTLSSAAGLSIYLAEQQWPNAKGVQPKVFCVLGDLSFFYDQNALWNQNLSGSLRILLLNNGGGAIFGKFDGLRSSAARERLVMAEHRTSACHVCEAHGVAYQNADDMASLRAGVDWLIHTSSECPMLLEVFTDIDADNRAVTEFFQEQ